MTKRLITPKHKERYRKIAAGLQKYREIADDIFELLAPRMRMLYRTESDDPTFQQECDEEALYIAETVGEYIYSAIEACKALSDD